MLSISSRTFKRGMMSTRPTALMLGIGGDEEDVGEFCWVDFIFVVGGGSRVSAGDAGL